MSEIRYFKVYCESLNELCRSMQETKEPVTREEADRALDYARSMDLKGAGDVLLFCSAINLMNTYVKQPGCKKFGYFFKGYVRKVFDYICLHPTEGINCNIQMDGKNSLAIVEVFGIQFSFHCVRGSKSITDGTTIEFDGIRKQRCAATLFKMAEANQLMRGKLEERISYNQVPLCQEAAEQTFSK